MMDGIVLGHLKFRVRGKRRMRVKGPKGTIYISPENIKKIPKNYFVTDEEGNVLFITKDHESADVAIQWAVDYQSSGETANE